VIIGRRRQEKLSGSIEPIYRFFPFNFQTADKIEPFDFAYTNKVVNIAWEFGDFFDFHMIFRDNPKVKLVGRMAVLGFN